MDISSNDAADKPSQRNHTMKKKYPYPENVNLRVVLCDKTVGGAFVGPFFIIDARDVMAILMDIEPSKKKKSKRKS